LSAWTKNLNSEQQQAALHNNGPMLILAGAGSGKTTVLVSRTGRLIDEKLCEAKQICVLTFTNKAATELKLRVTARLGDSGKGVWAGTFHSFGLQILKQFSREAGLPKKFGIIDSGDSQSLVKELLKDLKIAEKSDFDSGKLLSLMSDWRGKSSNLRNFNSEDPYHIAGEWLLPKYEKRLEHLGVVDFDGLLLKPLALFEKHPEIAERVKNAFTQIMVDEFQDTNRTQMSLVTRLSESHENITVVGDDDQSIYGWRGACIENILKFPKLYKSCVVVRLEENYRSTPAILNLANAIIIKNENRHGKILRAALAKRLPEADQGITPELFVYTNEDEESEKVADEIESQIKEGFKYSDVAILFRSNGQGALFEAEFKKRGVPHRMTGGTGFFERKEIKDVLAYLRCSIKPNEISLRRIINTPHRGLGEVTLEKLIDYSNTQKISLFDSLSCWRSIGLSETVGETIEALLKNLENLAPNVLRGTSHAATSMRLLEQLAHLGYRHHIEKHSKDQVQANQKWRLIEIFGNVLDKFIVKGGASTKTLNEFLNAMELHESIDDDEEEKKNSVQLLTLHGCKGLEFPIVYLVGLEEEILPHRTLGSDIAEERRLFYVGVTRAQQRLFLSRARERKRFGRLVTSAASRFLLELPPMAITEYAQGFRPISQDQRKNLLAALYEKIDSKNQSG
jgi:superfamily I DNA/RNA helicase